MTASSQAPEAKGFRWKLIAPTGRRGDVELYDLATDQAELHNVAAEHPDIVKSLRSKVDAWNATLPTEYIKSATNDDNK